MDLTPATRPSRDSTHSGYFVWEPEDERIAVHLHGEVVDRIGMAVMQGFAALRKRGAEVGGLLLGSVERGTKTVVKVEEFVEIPCAHLYGPSYALCADDMTVLDRALAEYSAEPSALLRVVGFCRSNTREQVCLSEADLSLLSARFSDLDDVCLLVKPFPMRPCEAVLLARGDGGFPVESRHGTFVFRRKEMQLPPAPRRDRGASPPQSRRLQPKEFTASKTEASTENSPESEFDPLGRGRFDRDSFLDVEDAPPVTSAERSRRRSRPAEAEYGEVESPHRLARGAGPRADIQPAQGRQYRWFWLWLSLALLLAGVFSGIALTLTLNSTQAQRAGQDPYSLGLRVSQFGGKFQLKWNPDLPAWRHARGGELLVEEGTARKAQQLSADDLARGGLIYRGSAAEVRFRLTVFLGAGRSLSEAVSTESAARP